MKREGFSGDGFLLTAPAGNELCTGDIDQLQDTFRLFCVKRLGFANNHDAFSVDRKR